MSRKKIKKDYVKRKTNIYDPMGIYSRGPTKEQKVGMSRQMKVQYLEAPKPRIDRQLLNDYKKTLQFYGMIGGSNFQEYNLVLKMVIPDITPVQETVTSARILQFLNDQGISPYYFSVGSFMVKRDGFQFPSLFSYEFFYGNGSKTVQNTQGSTAVQENSNTCVIPSYWTKDSKLYYYNLAVDSEYNDLYIQQSNSSIPGTWTDLINAHSEGEPMPFVKFPPGPDGVDPYIILSAVGDGIDTYELTITVNVFVVY